MSPEELFRDLVEPLYADPAVTRSTMMGLPYVRLHGRFFASLPLDRRGGALLVKLGVDRASALIAEARDHSAVTAAPSVRPADHSI